MDSAGYYAFSTICQVLAGAFSFVVAIDQEPRNAGAGSGIPTVQTLIIGALGGTGYAALSAALKYIADRLTESHKLVVGVAAKRRERYHEKQAVAVAGTYEKLTIYVDAVCGLYLWEAASLTHDQEERIRKELDEAHQARIGFQRFFAANEIYFPAPLACKVEELNRRLRRALLSHRAMTGPGPIGQAAGDDKATKLKETRDAAKELLGELKDKFRELLLGKDAGPSEGRPVSTTGEITTLAADMPRRRIHRPVRRPPRRPPGLRLL
jgi:hypothetical protein